MGTEQNRVMTIKDYSEKLDLTLFDVTDVDNALRAVNADYEQRPAFFNELYQLQRLRQGNEYKVAQLASLAYKGRRIMLYGVEGIITDFRPPDRPSADERWILVIDGHIAMADGWTPILLFQEE